MKKPFGAFTLACLMASQSYATTYYPAQILGRDLGIKGLGWAGHVSLTIAKRFSDTADAVIEVLNEVDVIQINSIETFKQTTRYWGSRYGIADNTPAAKIIIEEALKQRALCPIYTDSATYHAGLGTPDNPTRCAVFRCDTFINYLFHYAGYTLPTYRGKTLPRLVFKAFPKAHEDGFSTTDLSFEAFKAQFDKPPSHITPQSIRTTWQLAHSLKLSLQKRLFLLDYLGLNGSPELITAFIDDYQKQTHPAIKSMLIRSTFTLYQTHFLNQPHLELAAFYQTLLSDPLQTQDVPFVIRGFIATNDSKTILTFRQNIYTLLRKHQQDLPKDIQFSLYKLLENTKRLLYNSSSFIQ